MSRITSLLFLLLFIHPVHGFDGLVGVSALEASGDTEISSKTVYAEGNLPLNQVLSAQVIFGFTKTQTARFYDIDQEISRYAAGLFTTGSAKLAVRYSRWVEDLFGDVDQIDFDGSFQWSDNALVNLGISQLSTTFDEQYQLVLGLDSFQKKGILSFEMSFIEDQQLLGVQYRFFPVKGMAVFMHGFHWRFNSSGGESYSNAVGIGAQYYFFNAEKSAVIEKYRNRELFWQPFLR